MKQLWKAKTPARLELSLLLLVFLFAAVKQWFLADRTIGCAFGTRCRLSVVCLSVVCDVLYCGEMVRPSEKLSEGVNRKPGSRVDFSVAAIFLLLVLLLRPPIRPFCLIFACTAQQLALDGTNGLSSSKPCACCQIMWSELKPEVVLATVIDPERCK